MGIAVDVALPGSRAAINQEELVSSVVLYQALCSDSSLASLSAAAPSHLALHTA